MDQKKIDPLLMSMLKKVSEDKKISDLHLKSGIVPVVRKLGRLKILDQKFPIMTDNMIRKMVSSIMTQKHKEVYEEEKELDLGLGISLFGRFRFNIFQQRGTARAVIRSISHKVPTLKDLNLPPVIQSICHLERGLILVTGATGSGKSSTVAAMLDYINSVKTRHILTLEDPIEFLIADRKSIVSQRELGVDMQSFHSGLRSGLRQDPDVIFVGEMRDLETIRVALMAAQTGHLVISTLHTTDAKETLNRILGTFPREEQRQIQANMANCLQAVIAQRLIKQKKSKNLIPVTEVLLFTERVRNVVREGDFGKLFEAIEEGAEIYGMHSLEQKLVELVQEGLVDLKDAYSVATSIENLKVKLKAMGLSVRKKGKVVRPGSEDSTLVKNPLHQTSPDESLTSIDNIELDGKRVPPQKKSS